MIKHAVNSLIRPLATFSPDLGGEGTSANDAGSRAVFLDRDGTIVRSAGYVTQRDQIELLPDAASSIQRLRTAGFRCVLVTNQSAIGRGLLTIDGLATIHKELRRQLAIEEAEVDAIYFCPIAPNSDDETIVEYPDRKPGSGMLLKAAHDMVLDLSKSWMVGDRLSDVLAGIYAGCRSIRVKTGHRYMCPIRSIGYDYVTKYSIKEATDFILTEFGFSRISGGRYAGNSTVIGGLSGRVPTCDDSAES